MNTSVIPPTAPVSQAEAGEGDTDWSTYRGHCHFDLDLTGILTEAQNTARRAQIARSASGEPPTPRVREAPADALPWPPGRAGVIARFLFQTSYSPIQEVAIAATLGLLAGVCGRAYRTHTDRDLALYMILVAKSGVGKDAMHDGIPMMLDLAEQPMARAFLRAQDFVSGEALHKELLREPGFLYLQGEFGRKLKRMGNVQDSPMQTFRTVLTNSFAKRFLEGKTYSRAEDSLPGVDWPALSFLGETTPTTFLECLTPDMMADGFLSRFLIVSYDGGKPRPNRQRNAVLPPDDLLAWRDLVDHTIKYLMPFNVPEAIIATPDPAAEAMLDKFDDDCRDRLNATEDESERPVWTRAHLKALKVAGLLAVADNYLHPVVGVDHVNWALALVGRDIETFRRNQREGNIGADDDARTRKLVAIIRDYITRPSIPASYKVPPKMHRDALVTRSYLQQRSSTLPAFSNHRFGAGKALDEALRSMTANGWLMEARKTSVIDAYGHHGVTYRILELPEQTP